MKLCNCNKITHINYDIAQINSSYKTHADINSSVMSIGKNSHGFSYRVLIKFNFNHLPKNAQILRATLIINILNTAPECKCTIHQLKGLTLNSDWDISTVNWNNQPSINFSNKLFDESVNNWKKYTFDITNQVRNWYAYPSTNYGMILMGSEELCYNKIQICTESGSSNNLTLLVEYCEEREIHILPTQFYEYYEDITVYPGLEQFTTGRDISLTKTVSYFIKNNNSASITVIAENSPDNINFAKEIQTIIIPPGLNSLLVPINFSKYIRLSITVPPGGNTATINTWLQLQK